MDEESTKDRINDKVNEIEMFVEELYKFVPKNITLNDYKKDIAKKAIFERYAEKIIEAIEDLSFLMINYKKLNYPEYEKEVFDILSINNIISNELSKKFKEAKGMRNFIVHQYGKIDDEIVFNSITQEIKKDAMEFINSIRRIL